MSYERSQPRVSVPKLFSNRFFLSYRPIHKKPSSKSARQPNGFTIVEVLIFLAITGSLFVLAMSAFNGEQARAEFNTSIREVDAKLQDVINNVGSGLYSYDGKIQCQIVANKILLSTVATAQGTNTPCIYIGQFIHFAPHGTPSQLNVYSVAAKRIDSSGKEVTTIAAGDPLVIANGNGAVHNAFGPDTTDDFTMPFGLRATKVTYDNGAGPVPTGSAGFFTTFNQYSGNTLASGSTATDVVIITNPSPGINAPKAQMVDAIDIALNGGAANFIINPTNGIKVCLESDASKQVAVITISGQQSISTSIQVFNNKAAAGVLCV